jgi:hypothetical protein
MIFALRPAAWCFAPFYLMTERHGRDANPPPPGRNRWLWSYEEETEGAT